MLRLLTALKIHVVYLRILTINIDLLVTLTSLTIAISSAAHSSANAERPEVRLRFSRTSSAKSCFVPITRSGMVDAPARCSGSKSLLLKGKQSIKRKYKLVWAATSKLT